jgi:hypothetical protein
MFCVAPTETQGNTTDILKTSVCRVSADGAGESQSQV